MTDDTESDYSFVVVDETSGQPIKLTIVPHSITAKEQYNGVWQKLSQAVQKHHQLHNAVAPSWTKWKPGDWCEQKNGFERRQKFVAWAGPILLGFLNVWPDFPSTHQSGEKVLYVEHLAAAPGNLGTDLWRQRFKYVGLALFTYAIYLSKSLGFGGRIGLHAADDGALEYYRHLSRTRCDDKLLHPELSGVKGPTPQGEHDLKKTFLETRGSEALTWLETYRHE